MKTSEIIRDLCKIRGISVTDLEKELGFSNGSLTKPKTKSISSDRLYALSKKFGVSMEYLMGEICEDDVDPNKITVDILKRDPVFFSNIINLLSLPEEYRRSIYEQIDFQMMKFMNETKEKDAVSAG